MGWNGNTSLNVSDYPEPPAEKPMSRCPVCGEECEKYYVQDFEILGCEHCITQEYADEYEVE